MMNFTFFLIYRFNTVFIKVEILLWVQFCFSRRIFNHIFLSKDDGKLSFDEFKAYFSDGVLSGDELKELFHTIDTHNTE